MSKVSREKELYEHYKNNSLVELKYWLNDRIVSRTRVENEVDSLLRNEVLPDIPQCYQVTTFQYIEINNYVNKTYSDVELKIVGHLHYPFYVRYMNGNLDFSILDQKIKYLLKIKEGLFDINTEIEVLNNMIREKNNYIAPIPEPIQIEERFKSIDDVDSDDESFVTVKNDYENDDQIQPPEPAVHVTLNEPIKSDYSDCSINRDKILSAVQERARKNKNKHVEQFKQCYRNIREDLRQNNIVRDWLN